MGIYATSSHSYERTSSSPSVPVSVLLSSDELYEATLKASDAKVGIPQWLVSMALLEAWRVVHGSERSWPWGFPPAASAGVIAIDAPFTLDAIDAIREATAQIFFWVGGDLKTVGLSEFVNGAVRRQLSKSGGRT